MDVIDLTQSYWREGYDKVDNNGNKLRVQLIMFIYIIIDLL